MAFGVEPINPLYSMYTVTLYFNTGFNTFNIPDSVSLIESSASAIVELPAIDILQKYNLSSVTCNISGITEEQSAYIESPDYCKIDDVYYSVPSIGIKTSYDVITYPLVFAAFVTARSQGTVASLGGTTVRRRVSASEDTFGAYTEDDPLLTPQKPLKLIVGKSLFGGATSIEWVLINSSIDLSDLQSRHTGSTLVGKTFTDPNNSDSSVTVPYVNAVTTGTTFSCGDITLPTLGTMIYRSDLVTDAIGLARALGVDSAIINQYRLPVEFVELFNNGNISSDGHVDSIQGIDKTVDCGLTLNYAKVRNNKLLYGENNRYGIITAAGNKIEFRPEYICDGLTDNIRIRCIADVRPDGAVYFRYEKYLGDSSTAMFFNNCVKGLGWDEAPLMYTKPSGNWKTTDNFETSRYISYGNFYGGLETNAALRRFNNTVGASQGLFGIASGVSYGHIPSGGVLDVSKTNGFTFDGQQMYSGASGLGSAVLNEVSGELSDNLRKWNFEQQKQQELKNFGYSQNVVVPEIQFPGNSGLIGDVLGHGCIPYRYEYDSADLSRLDTLLTMYGYKETEPFKESMFNSHKDFEYLELEGVQVKADTLPMWWKNAIIDELNGGIRIWHVKPDFGYFDGTKTAE